MASCPVAKLDPRGTRVTMLYDAANRLTSRRYPDGRRNTFAYDAVGNEVLMLDPTGRTTTTYSPRGEVSCVAHPGDKRISYSYDALSRRSVMMEPDGGRFTYSHDVAGRLTGLVNPQDQRTSFTFDALGRQVTKELANGSITTQAYDAAGRLSGVTNRKSSGDVISSFAYAYDQAGNRTGVLEANGVRTSWSYDKTYQLTHEHRGGHFAFNVTYTYDPAGNRLVQEDSGDRTTYTYDAANQLLTEESSAGRTTYTHDAAGNRTEKEAPAGTTYYTWDEDNRMVAAEPPAGVVTMTYTAAGARVRKESVTDTKRFLYDFNNVLAELDADDNTDRLYTQTVEEYGDLVSNDHGDHTDYYAYDGLGSTDALVDDTETLLARHAYRAFGLEQSGGDPNDAFSFVGRQGYYRDDEIDLYLLGAASGGRHYDTDIARFISRDPIGFAGRDANLFRYVGNCPMSYTDPNGRVTYCGAARKRDVFFPCNNQQQTKWVFDLMKEDSALWPEYHKANHVRLADNPDPVVITSAEPPGLFEGAALSFFIPAAQAGKWLTYPSRLVVPIDFWERQDEALDAAYDRMNMNDDCSRKCVEGATLGWAVGFVWWGGRVIVGWCRPAAAPAATANAARIAELERRLVEARQLLAWNLQQAEHTLPGTPLGDYFTGRIVGLRAQIEGLETALRSLGGLP